MNRTKSIILLAGLWSSLVLGTVLYMPKASGQANTQELTAMQRLLTATVAVNSQTRSERAQALQVGFADVLVRISGHANVLELERVRSELRRAGDYVIQYGYSTEQGQTMLRAGFNREKVLQLLREAESSIWSERRPTVMMWLAAESKSGARTSTEFISTDSDHEMLASFNQQAQKRGLQFTFPLLDLTDRLIVSPRDVWGRFEKPVLEATERYSADGITMVRLLEEVDGYVAEWRILVGGLEATGVVKHTSFEQLGVLLADAMVEQVADEYAVNFSSSEQTDVYIRVLNANNLGDVFAVEKLLNSLGPVTGVKMTRYHLGTTEFTLRVVGNKARVEQSLELEYKLQQIQDPWSLQQNDILEYRWLP